jgi:hypothetical protein
MVRGSNASVGKDYAYWLTGNGVEVKMSNQNGATIGADEAVSYREDKSFIERYREN